MIILERWQGVMMSGFHWRFYHEECWNPPYPELRTQVRDAPQGTWVEQRGAIGPASVYKWVETYDAYCSVCHKELNERRSLKLANGAAIEFRMPDDEEEPFQGLSLA